MSKIYYLMGKSASGKDSLYKEIRKRHPELKTAVIYTTRPIRRGEADGVNYFFTDENGLRRWQEAGKVIELRSYNTMHGIWHYFTVDDGQFDQDDQDILLIGTLESYVKLRDYFGEERMVPIYIEVEDGLRLSRAVERERKQENPKYAELCRRFLADSEDFSEEKLLLAGITKRYENVHMENALAEIELLLN